jgi:hypothetical protein
VQAVPGLAAICPRSSDRAARPIHESLPDLPTAIRATVVSDVEVQVKVPVDESGRVARVDLVGSTGPGAVLWSA